MSIHLPSDVQAIIQAKIAGGEFTSETEVVSAGVRLLQEHGDLMRKHAELQALVREGLEAADRGEFFDGEEVFDEVLRELSDPDPQSP